MEYDAKTKISWGSHVPINNAILEAFPITGVLELGAGYHSTAAFFEKAPKTVSIETDLAWIEEMRKTLKEDDEHRLVHYQVPKEITRSVRRRNVSEQFLYTSVEFFRKHKEPDLNFLFIDCISSLRYEALIRLYEKFDVITFHDYQDLVGKRGIQNHYNGKEFEPNSDYIMLVDETYLCHTGVLVHKKYEDMLDDLYAAHANQVDGYFKGYKQKLVRK